MQVTLRDVAARAGLSVSAVSQALRNQPRIPVETRERVRRIADDLGYRPLVAFAALGQRRAARPASMAMLNVAVIAARPERLHRRPELEAIRAEFESRGYNVSLLSTAMLGASPRRRLGHRGIVGCVVIEPALIRFSLENELADVSAAILGGSDHRLPFNVVRGHYFHASREAVRRLVAAGYRRIGLAPARHSPAISDDHERFGGAFSELWALQGAGAEIPPYLGPILDQSAYASWCVKHRPEVVLGFNDLSWMWLNAAIPDPASRPDFAALALHPAMQRVSGMFHDPRRFAAAAADSVDHQVRHGIRGPLRQSHDILVPLEWIDGGTCRFSTG